MESAKAGVDSAKKSAAPIKIGVMISGAFRLYRLTATATRLRKRAYEEVPVVSTTASGEFLGAIAPDGEVINYTETYSGLQAPVTQSHMHVGQLP